MDLSEVPTESLEVFNKSISEAIEAVSERIADLLNDYNRLLAASETPSLYRTALLQTTKMTIDEGQEILDELQSHLDAITCELILRKSE